MGYVSSIQNVIPKESINIMGTTIKGIDIELKMEISRNKYLESKNSKYKRIFIEIIIS